MKNRTLFKTLLNFEGFFIQTKNCTRQARRLSVKRLVEAIGMERKRRYPSPVLAPDEPPSPEVWGISVFES